MTKKYRTAPQLYEGQPGATQFRRELMLQLCRGYNAANSSHSSGKDMASHILLMVDTLVEAYYNG